MARTEPFLPAHQEMCTEEPCPIAVDAASQHDIAPFEYVCEAVLPEGTPGAASAAGCACGAGACSKQRCSCAAECSAGLVALQGGADDTDVLCLLECGPACECGPGCGARPSQGGVTVELCISRMPGKAWGVVTKQPLSEGTFVCCYHGEFLRNDQAQERLAEYDRQLSTEGEGHALLVLRVVLPSGRSALRLNIDATRRGNIARFINHRCGGGNLTPIITMYRGCLVPRVALFANRDIAAGEELTFAYGAPYAGPAGGGHNISTVAAGAAGRPSNSTIAAGPASSHSDGTTAAGASVDLTAAAAGDGRLTQEAAAVAARACRCGSDSCLGFLPTGGV